MATTSPIEIPDELRVGLRHYWYPVLPSAELPTDRPIGIRRLDEELVLWRDAEGLAHTFVDRCAHRGARLSIGDVVDGRLQCRYHGLQYDGTGQCRLVPIEQAEDGRQAQRLCVNSYPTAEQDGAVWAYLGDVDVFPPGPVPAHDEHPELADSSYVWIVKALEWRANWLLVHDNTSDLFHFPFLHGHYGVHPAGAERPRLEQLPPRNPVISDEMAEVLAFDEYKTTATSTSVLSRRKGYSDGSTIDDVEFVVPCSAKVWVPVPIGGHPVRSIQYEMAQDDRTTYVLFFIGCGTDSEEEREPSRELLETFCWQAFSQVFDEDSWVVDNQGGLDRALRDEHPLKTDAGPLRVRKVILDTYRAQQARLAEQRGANGEGRAAAVETAG